VPESSTITPPEPWNTGQHPTSVRHDSSSTRDHSLTVAEPRTLLQQDEDKQIPWGAARWYVVGGWALDPFRGREGFWPVDGAGGVYFQYQQTMVRDPSSGRWRVDVIRAPDDGASWICALDRNIHLRYDDAVARTSGGIPYLRPELVLLFKGLQTRPKDQADFNSTAPLISTAARAWLAQALVKTKGDDHPWIGALEGSNRQ
jgi:hypothetical protein